MCVKLKQSHTGVHSGQQLHAMISIFVEVLQKHA